MGDVFTDRKIIVTGNKTYPDFHTFGWMSMIVDVTSVGGRNKKWFLDGSVSNA